MDDKTASDQVLPLTGKRVLLVEDEYYIADDLKRTLHGAGAIVVGPFSSVAKAREAVGQGGFDCAVIDLNLNGEDGAPIADLLIERGKSFAIATGYGLNSIPERFSEVPRIENLSTRRHCWTSCGSSAARRRILTLAALR